MREWLAAPTESNWSSFPKEFLRKRFMIGTYWYYLFLTPMVVSSKKVPLMEINSCRRWSWWFFNASTAVWRTQVFHKAKCTCFACARGEGPLVIDVTMYQIGLGVLATPRCSPRRFEVRPDGQRQDLHHDGTSQAPGGNPRVGPPQGDPVWNGGFHEINITLWQTFT